MTMLHEHKRLEKLFRERAHRLAKRTLLDPNHLADGAQFALCEVAGEKYAIAIAAIRAVVSLIHVFRVPGAPREIVGLISVRGRIHTIADLAALLNLPPAAQGAGIAMLLRAGDQLGIRVDAVGAVTRIDTSLIHRESALLAGLNPRGILGVLPNEVVVLDPEALAKHPHFSDSTNTA